MKTVNPAPAAQVQMAVDPAYATADAVILIVPSGKGYEVIVDNRAELPDDVLAPLVSEAADQIAGVNDRTRGAWGR